MYMPLQGDLTASRTPCQLRMRKCLQTSRRLKNGINSCSIRKENKRKKLRGAYAAQLIFYAGGISRQLFYLEALYKLLVGLYGDGVVVGEDHHSGL